MSTHTELSADEAETVLRRKTTELFEVGRGKTNDLRSRDDEHGIKVETSSATVSAMSESLIVTIVYELGEEGWVVASIPEVPGANSQGRTRAEARANVIDALRGILELRFGGHPKVSEGTDSEPLELVIGA